MAYLPLHFESARQEDMQWSRFSCWQLPVCLSADAREFCAAHPAASHPSWVVANCGCACPCAEQVLATPKNWSRCGWGIWEGSSVGSTYNWKMNELLSVRFLQPPFIRFDEGAWSCAVTAGCYLQNLLQPQALGSSRKAAWEAVYVCRLAHPTIAPLV